MANHIETKQAQDIEVGDVFAAFGVAVDEIEIISGVIYFTFDTPSRVSTERYPDEPVQILTEAAKDEAAGEARKARIIQAMRIDNS